MAQVIASTAAGITAGWENAAAVRQFLEAAWQQHLAGGVPATTGDIAPYSRRATAHALAGLLDQVQF